MKYTDRLKEYRYRKAILERTCSSSEEYEKKVKELIEELRI